MNVAGYYTWVFFFAKESFFEPKIWFVKINYLEPYDSYDSYDMNHTVRFMPDDEKASKELATNV